jgi:hypothetical protein
VAKRRGKSALVLDIVQPPARRDEAPLALASAEDACGRRISCGAAEGDPATARRRDPESGRDR